MVTIATEMRWLKTCSVTRRYGGVYIECLKNVIHITGTIPKSGLFSLHNVGLVRIANVCFRKLWLTMETEKQCFWPTKGTVRGKKKKLKPITQRESNHWTRYFISDRGWMRKCLFSSSFKVHETFVWLHIPFINDGSGINIKFRNLYTRPCILSYEALGVRIFVVHIDEITQIRAVLIHIAFSFATTVDIIIHENGHRPLPFYTLTFAV